MTQTIFRAAHGKQPYFLMLRTTAQDSNLSFEARGLIAYLLSKPNDWEINKADMMREGCLGRTKMKRVIDELTEHGYLTMSQGRDENNLFTEVIYTLHEEPQAENVQAEPVAQNVQADTREAANTFSVKREIRIAGNDHQHNTESIHNTESTEKSKDIAPEAQPAEPEQPDPVEDALPVKTKTDHQLMFEAVCSALHLDWNYLTDNRKTTIGKTATAIRKAQGKPEHIPRFMEWLRAKAQADKWSGDVTEHAMNKYWGDYASQVLFPPKPKIAFHVDVPQWRIDAGFDKDCLPPAPDLEDVA